MSAHELTGPFSGRRGWQVSCSCGYITAPTHFPGYAQNRAEEHKRAKEADR